MTDCAHYRTLYKIMFKIHMDFGLALYRLIVYVQ